MLHIAAGNGYLEIVEKLIEKDAKLEAVSNEGGTALLFAAKNGYLEIVEKLIEKGAKLEAADKEDWTALHWAAKEGHLEIVEKLIEKGAKLEAADNEGWTALHFAAGNGRLKIVEKLIEYKAKILKDTSGKTPIDLVKEQLSKSTNASDKAKLTKVIGILKKICIIFKLSCYNRLI